MFKSEETEKIILSSLILDSKMVDRFISDIKPEYFYSSINFKIFVSIADLDAQGHDVDIVAINSKLKDEHFDYLVELTTNFVSTKDLKSHIKTLKECFERRELFKACQSAQNQLKDSDLSTVEIINTIEFETLKLTENQEKNEAKTIKDLLPETFDRIDERSKGAKPEGIPTSLNGLDSIITALPRRELWIMAALPSMGKTALSMQIAIYAASKGYNVIFYSFEMSKQSIMYRVLSYATLLVSSNGVSGERIEKKKLTKSELNIVGIAAGVISDIGDNLLIDDNKYNIIELRRDLRKKTKNKKVDLVVIDYLQIMPTIANKSGRSDLEIAQITTGLKDLAKEHDCCVLPLGQFNRKGNRDGKPPRLSDMAGSSAIENDIDGSIIIHNSTRSIHRYDDSAETQLIIGKNRNGKTGVCIVKPELSCYKFYDVEQHHDETMDYQQEW